MKILLGLFLCFISSASILAQEATVYFYRVKEVNALDNKNAAMRINNQKIFEMKQRHYIGVKLKPGSYELKIQKTASEMLLEVEAGKTYFIRISKVPAGFSYTESLTEVPEKQAVYQMRDLPVLPNSQIKSKDLTFIKEKPSPN